MNKDNPYLLLTPGPLSTSRTVREAMLKDWCTWDDDYNLGVVQAIRARLEALTGYPDLYSSVLMQGSGTASVEACLGSVIGQNHKLLIVDNGAYGARMVEIARRLNILHRVYSLDECQPADPQALARLLAEDDTISHVAMVHCETTTGLLNPLEAVGRVVQQAGRCFIVDAMSSFGGIPIDFQRAGIDFLISSANKCIQGVPGFGLVLARRSRLLACEGQARSLSLDLFDQWRVMEQGGGKWRFTSPTHVVRAFHQALLELEQEGGVAARHARYCENQRRLVAGMVALGFEPLLDEALMSPIITSFLAPTAPGYDFKGFYERLKGAGFVIYPGKVSRADCFRIGNIGEVYPADMDRLLAAVAAHSDWQG